LSRSRSPCLAACAWATVLGALRGRGGAPIAMPRPETVNTGLKGPEKADAFPEGRGCRALECGGSTLGNRRGLVDGDDLTEEATVSGCEVCDRGRPALLHSPGTTLEPVPGWEGRCPPPRLVTGDRRSSPGCVALQRTWDDSIPRETSVSGCTRRV